MRTLIVSVAILGIALFVCGCNQDNSGTAANTGNSADATPKPPTKATAPPTEAAKPDDASKPPASGDAKPADGGAATAVSFTKDVQPMGAKYCMPCHGDNGKGGLSLTKYKTDDDAKADKALWGKAASEVENKKMPPAKAPNQPTDDERAKLVAALKGLSS